MAGYTVVEAANLHDLLSSLDRQTIDVVVASRNLDPKDGSALASAMHKRPGWEGIPTLALTDSEQETRAFDHRAAGFHGCVFKQDRDAVLESVAHIASMDLKAETARQCVGAER
jgi:CheY-like chemotaxis protein